MDLNTLYIVLSIFGAGVFLFFGLAGGYSSYISKPFALIRETLTRLETLMEARNKSSDEFRALSASNDKAILDKFEKLSETDAAVEMQLSQHNTRLDKHEVEIDKLKKAA